ncbi:hypothetical protein G6F59_017468 [Rhizopus arrhizus]|nr:hypothetical protein G6F59_017468 [Rhizopus arrhizus]
MHQAVVQPALRHELRMRAGFHDTALVQHQAAIGADHAGQPVSQDQRRAARHQAVQRLLDQRLVCAARGQSPRVGAGRPTVAGRVHRCGCRRRPAAP